MKLPKINPHRLVLALISGLFVCGMGMFEIPEFYKNEFNYPEKVENEQEANEEPPKQKEAPPVHPDSLSSSERKAYEAKMAQLRQSNYDFSLLLGQDIATNTGSNFRTEAGPVSYANGAISGTWQHKIPRTSSFGYRVVNSEYDAFHDQLYAVSTPGHLWRLDRSPSVNWTLLDNKGNYTGILAGVTLANNTFRLLRNAQPTWDVGYMEYSDDQAQTWTKSTGALFQNSWAWGKAVVNKTNGGKRIFLYGAAYSGSVEMIQWYYSDDYGVTFKSIPQKFSNNDYAVKFLNPQGSDNVYVAVRANSTSLISIYKFDDTALDFKLLRSPSQTFGPLNKFYGNYANGKFNFYLYINSLEVWYSPDEGVTWTQKNANYAEALIGAHPTNPNIIFSGAADIHYSSDNGATWSAFNNKLGWDFHHLSSYKQTNGTWFNFWGMDFGCFLSTTPENASSYTWLNDRSPTTLHYDAASSEKYNSIYMANQDKGASAYLDTNTVVNTNDIAGTDVLRVEFAQAEQSVWIWFYYGQITHLYNFPTKQTGTANKTGLGNWWAAPIVASPDPTEDAIYVAGQANLMKLNYVKSSNSITTTTHPYNFYTSTSQNISGFGYSSLNKNKWYVSVFNGRFFYSNDGGNNWTETSYKGTMPPAEATWEKRHHTIRASTLDANKVYFAGKQNYFLISTDGGVTFTNHASGLPNAIVRDFALSPDEKYVYAALTTGAYVYSVKDDKWYPMTGADVANVDFTDVQYVKSKNTVRFATFGYGILDFVLDPGTVTDLTAATLGAGTVMRAYPNPAKKDLFVDGLARETKMEVYNTAGQWVLSTSSQHQLDVSSLRQGSYILRLDNGTSLKFNKE
jgi:hypothetical protein